MLKKLKRQVWAANMELTARGVGFTHALFSLIPGCCPFPLPPSPCCSRTVLLIVRHEGRGKTAAGDAPHTLNDEVYNTESIAKSRVLRQFYKIIKNIKKILKKY